MRVLAFGTYDTNRHPRVGVLIEGLRAFGDEVVEVNIPLDLNTAARVAALRQPWRLPPVVLRLVCCWSLLVVRAWRAQRRHRCDAVLVGYLGHFDVVLARLLFRRLPIVLDQLVFAADTARDRGITSRRKLRLLDRIDRIAMRSADLVVVDTEEATSLVPRRFADRVVTVPVGAGRTWFEAGARAIAREPAFGEVSGTPTANGAGPGVRPAEPATPAEPIKTAEPAEPVKTADPAEPVKTAMPAEPAMPTRSALPTGSDASAGAARRVSAGAPAGVRDDHAPMRVVFFGLFTPLQGTPVLAEALGQLADCPDVEALLVGCGQDHDEARRLAADNPRVVWRTWVPAAELPDLVASHDVCLGIFGTTPKALRVVPNKVYQGAAAGCAVVTSDTPPQRLALGDTAWLVPPGDAKALAEALRALAADRRRLAELRSAARQRAALAFTSKAAAGTLRQRLEARTATTRRAAQ